PGGVKPLIQHNICKFVIKLLGDDLCGFKCALGGTRKDQIGRHPALCQALTHFRSVAFAAVVQGRSLSSNAGSSRLDLAWRTRNSVFMSIANRIGNSGSLAALTFTDLR